MGFLSDDIAEIRAELASMCVSKELREYIELCVEQAYQTGMRDAYRDAARSAVMPQRVGRSHGTALAADGREC